MATTGAKFPAAGTSVSASPHSDDTWQNPGAIVADDATSGTDTTHTAYITANTFDTGDQSYLLVARGFDFSAIPDGSTINGVILNVQAWNASGLTGSLDLAQLLSTAATPTPVGTNMYATPQALNTTTTQVWSKGSSSDTWGNALTAAWAKSGNFGVAIGVISTSANTDVYCDYVTLEVFFTPPAAVTLACAAVAAVATGAAMALIVNTVTSVARVGLAGAVIPGSRTTHSINVRARIQTSGTVKIRAALYEGAVNRSGDLESLPLTATVETRTLPISDVAAASITDYNQLELRVWAHSAPGSTPVVEIQEAWLQVPWGAKIPTGVPCVAASAVGSGRPALLGMFVDGTHATATGGTVALKTAAPLQCSTSTANATGTATVTTLTAGVLPCAPSASQASASVALNVPPKLACTATSTATGQPVVLAMFADAAFGHSSATVDALSAPPVIEPGLLDCYAAQAQASTSSVLLPFYPDIAAARATASAALTAAAPMAWSTSTATATTQNIALAVPIVPLLACSASSAQAAASAVLIVPPKLQCTATATATGRSVLLGRFLDPNFARATGANVTLMAMLPCAASSANATSRSMLLGAFLDAAAGQLTGSVAMTIPAPLPADACSATASGAAVSLNVPGVAMLGAVSCDAALTATTELTVAVTAVPSSSTATAGGRVTLSFWLNAATGTSGATLAALYTRPVLPLTAANSSASGTLQLRTSWRWTVYTAATGQPTVVLVPVRLLPDHATATSDVSCTLTLPPPAPTIIEEAPAGIIGRPEVGRIASMSNGRLAPQSNITYVPEHDGEGLWICYGSEEADMARMRRVLGLPEPPMAAPKIERG